MKMNEATSLALRCCLFTGIAVLMIGLVLSGTDYGNSILWLGILILIMSPFVGILITYSYLISEKDWIWVKVATVLVVIIVVFLTISLWTS